MKIKFHENNPTHTITFNVGGNDEMLREGFWVRGVKVEQGPKEAEEVYEAFKQWMMWTRLNEPRY